MGVVLATLFVAKATPTKMQMFKLLNFHYFTTFLTAPLVRSAVLPDGTLPSIPVTFLAVSFAASAGEHRPPTPTVALVAALLAAFSGVQSGLSNPAELSGTYNIAARIVIDFRTDFFAFVFMLTTPVMVLSMLVLIIA